MSKKFQNLSKLTINKKRIANKLNKKNKRFNLNNIQKKSIKQI